MGTKKDIGKIFKDRLKDFEETPDTSIWESIASELDKKSARRIAPLWYYFGGLLLLGIIGSLWLLSNPNEAPSNLNPSRKLIVETTPQKNHNTHKITSKSKQEKIPITETISTDTIDIAQQKEQFTSSVSNTSTKPSTLKATPKNTTTDQKNYYNNTRSKGLNATTNAQDDSNEKQERNNAVASEVTLESIKKQVALEKNRREVQNKKDLVAYQKKIKKQGQDALDHSPSVKDQPSPAQKEIPHLLTEEIPSNASTESPEEVAARLAKNQKGEKLKNSKKTKDEEEPKTVEERQKDREKASPYHITISPYASLLSYGSLSKGSSIDDKLVDNPRESTTTIGYGVRIDYALSSRAKLRLGVGYSPLQYRTDNFQISINNGNINIYDLTAISAQSLDQNTATSENTPEAIAFFNSNSIVSIRQDISYLEIPLELQYNIINKRFSLSVSPGINLFLLDNNEISAIAETGESIFVGEESNLNNFSLGVSFGIGGHYNIDKSWRLNIEPIFRYQINPYNNALSNFRPYYLGVQFGTSYKF